MSEYLTALEEFDFTQEIQMPHLNIKPEDKISKLKVAFDVAARRPDEVLIISLYGFDSPAIIAGLKREHIEYFAKNAPKEYKEILLNNILNPSFVKDAITITKDMDRERSKKDNYYEENLLAVIRYIRSNAIVFNFDNSKN